MNLDHGLFILEDDEECGVILTGVKDRNVTEAVIPEGVNRIAYRAFTDCPELRRVTIPSGIKRFDFLAFECDKLKTVYYTGTLEQWCKIYFDGEESNPCWHGADLYIQGELLRNAVIPDGMASVPHCVFMGCSSITSVTIPSSVSSIGYRSFWGCSSITSVTIPNSVASIGEEAFSFCTALTSVAIGSGVASIDNDAFSGCDNLHYNTYGNAKYLGNSSNPYVALISASNTSISNVSIHSDTKCIAAGAFSGCHNLTSVVIPSSISSIHSETFRGCTALTSVAIGSGVRTICARSFADCTSLTSVTIPDSIEEIGDDPFSCCWDKDGDGYEDEFSCNEMLTLHGKPGSYAEKYAREHNLKFVPDNGD